MDFFVNIIIVPKLSYYLAIVGYFILGYFHNSNIFLAIVNYFNIGLFFVILSNLKLFDLKLVLGILVCFCYFELYGHSKLLLAILSYFTMGYFQLFLATFGYCKLFHPTCYFDNSRQFF
jgi:hypothetical protein